jgi:hypothetical protein
MGNVKKLPRPAGWIRLTCFDRRFGVIVSDCGRSRCPLLAAAGVGTLSASQAGDPMAA